MVHPMEESVSMGPHDGCSTISSNSQPTAESSSKAGAQYLQEHETNPTSRPSFDTADQKPLDTGEMLQETEQESTGLVGTPEEADHDSHVSNETARGSFSLRTRTTGSSSSSDDSRKNLPFPSMNARIEGIGSHLANESSLRADPEYGTADAETQALRPRFDRVTGSYLDAFTWLFTD